jgi:hypothetical protein
VYASLASLVRPRAPNCLGLHFDFDWKTSHHIRKEGIKRNSDGVCPDPGIYFNRQIPLHLDQFCSCLERQEKKSVLDPLEWCRFLTLEVDTATLDFGVTSTAEIVFILLRCNRIRNADIYLRLRDENTLPAFQFIWGLISRSLSKQGQADVRVTLDIDDLKLSLSDLFGGLRERLTELEIYTNRSQIECFPEGSLSMFERLRYFLFLPSANETVYSHHKNREFWKEVENLPLVSLMFVSPYPALKWNGEIARLPTSIRYLNITFKQCDCVVRNPMDFLRQLPNLQHLSLNIKYGPHDDAEDRDDDAEIDHPTLRSQNCLLCQKPVVTAHPLMALQLEVACNSEAFRAAILASPLLRSITFPPRSNNDDVVFVASSCNALESVDFFLGPEDQLSINAYGLVFLCKAKKLKRISLDGLEWREVEGLLEPWALQLPCLERVYYRMEPAKEIILENKESWEVVKVENFLAGYGPSQFCCLEEEAKGVVLQDRPKWSPENSACMKIWLCSYLREEEGYYAYLDMVAMREALISDRI